MESEGNCNDVLSHVWSSLCIESLGDISVVRPTPPAVNMPASSCASEVAKIPYSKVEDTRKRKHSEDSCSEQLRQKKKKRRKDTSPENNVEKEKSKKNGYESSLKECDGVPNKSRHEMFTLYNETSTCRLQQAYNAVADFKDKLTVLSRSERPSLLVEVRKEKIDSVVEEHRIEDEVLPQTLLLLPSLSTPPESPVETATSPSPPPLPVAPYPLPPPPPPPEFLEDTATSPSPPPLPVEPYPLPPPPPPPEFLEDTATSPSSLPLPVEPYPLPPPPPPPEFLEASTTSPSPPPLPVEPYPLPPPPPPPEFLEDTATSPSPPPLPVEPYPLPPPPPPPEFLENTITSPSPPPLSMEPYPLPPPPPPPEFLEDTATSPSPLLLLEETYPCPPPPPPSPESLVDTATYPSPPLLPMEPYPLSPPTPPPKSPVDIATSPSHLSLPVKLYSCPPPPPPSPECLVDTATSLSPLPLVSSPHPQPLSDNDEDSWLLDGYNEDRQEDICMSHNVDDIFSQGTLHLSVPLKCDAAIPTSVPETHEFSQRRKEDDSTDNNIEIEEIERDVTPWEQEVEEDIGRTDVPIQSAGNSENEDEQNSTGNIIEIEEIEREVTPREQEVANDIGRTDVPTQSAGNSENEDDQIQKNSLEYGFSKISQDSVFCQDTSRHGKINSEYFTVRTSEVHGLIGDLSHAAYYEFDMSSILVNVTTATPALEQEEARSASSNYHANKMSSVVPVTRRESSDHHEDANQMPTAAVSASKLASRAPKKNTNADVNNKVGSGQVNRRTSTRLAELYSKIGAPSYIELTFEKSWTVRKPSRKSAKKLRKRRRVSFFNTKYKIPNADQLSFLSPHRKCVQVDDEFDFLGSDDEFSLSSDSLTRISKGMSKLVFPEHVVCYAIKHKLLFPRGHNLFKENVKIMCNLLSRFSSSPDRRYIYFYCKNPQNSEQDKRKEGQGALSLLKSKAASKSFCSNPVLSGSQKHKSISALPAQKPTSEHTESHSSSSKSVNSKSVSRQSTSKTDISHKSVPNQQDCVTASSPKPSSLPSTSSGSNVNTVVSPSVSAPEVSPPEGVLSKPTVTNSFPTATPKPLTLKSHSSKSTSPKRTIDSSPKFPKVISSPKPTTVSNPKIADVVPTPKPTVRATSQKPMAAPPKKTVISNPKVPKAAKPTIDTTPHKPVAASPTPTTVSNSQRPKAGSSTPTSVPNLHILNSDPKSTPIPKPHLTKAESATKLAVDTIPSSASEAANIPTPKIPEAVSANKPTVNTTTIITNDGPVPKLTTTPNIEIPKNASVSETIATTNSYIDRNVSAPTTLIPEIPKTRPAITNPEILKAMPALNPATLNPEIPKVMPAIRNPEISKAIPALNPATSNPEIPKVMPTLKRAIRNPEIPKAMPTIPEIPNVMPALKRAIRNQGIAKNMLAVKPATANPEIRKLESDKVPNRQKENSLPFKKRIHSVSQADVHLNRRKTVKPSLDSYPSTLMLSIAETVAEIEKIKLSEAQALTNSIQQPPAGEIRPCHVIVRPIPVLATSFAPPHPIVAPAMRGPTFPYPHMTPAASVETIVPLAGTYHTNLASIPGISFKRQRSPNSRFR